MATSFLDKTGLGTLWTKIKSTFALKSEIPDSTSDLTNDSGFIDSARFDITLTSSAGSTPEETVYTADKTYQQITTAITEGKIPYVTFSGYIAHYIGNFEGEYAFEYTTYSTLDGKDYENNCSFWVDNTNTWESYEDSKVQPAKLSDLQNDSGFITDAGVTSFNGTTGDVTYSAVTYTLSISNNVITLTGSDGSTSTVTLPVYSGGVSS